MDKLDSFHLSGSKFSKFGGDIPGRQDYETMTKFEREGFTQVSEFNFTLRDTKVDIFDDVAIATFILDYNYVMADDSTIYKKKRFSMVFVQDSDQWKIVHEHSSAYVE
jgi:ketosteroid isomerase-like protein